MAGSTTQQRPRQPEKQPAKPPAKQPAKAAASAPALEPVPQPAVYDDAQVLDAETRAFLSSFADALEKMQGQIRTETREAARPKGDRTEVRASNESLYKLGLKQFLARPEEAKRAPRVTRGTSMVVGGDTSLQASLKANMSRALGSFEQKKSRGR